MREWVDCSETEPRRLQEWQMTSLMVFVVAFTLKAKFEEHRWEKAMADEWGGATFVTTNDNEEWRKMWSSHREQMNNEDGSED